MTYTVRKGSKVTRIGDKESISFPIASDITFEGSQFVSTAGSGYERKIVFRRGRALFVVYARDVTYGIQNQRIQAPGTRFR